MIVTTTIIHNDVLHLSVIRLANNAPDAILNIRDHIIYWNYDTY